MRAHILIVDDSPVNVKLIRVMLEADGHVASVAYDAQSALRQLERMVPDLILMDLQMPEMDGLTLTRMLKADARLGRVPIVALTAYAMTGDSERAKAAGCDAYFTKPIDTRTFVPSILSLILPSRVEEAAAQ
jgi:two-component system, cell cycle response regulator DivK